MEIIIPDLAHPAIWISLLTLSFLEIVLGIDNIIFISIVAGKLPEHQQRRARNLGLLLAMFFRIGLLFSITWIIGLKEPVFSFSGISGVTETPFSLSWKDIILIAGGLFLIVKSTLEVHHKLKADAPAASNGNGRRAMSFGSVIVQIILVDAVFSFDSILTAVGLVDNVLVMIVAVIISIGVMMLFAGPVTRIINQHPSLQILALSFLVVIGVVLVAGGFHQEVSKSIIYSCLGFSLVVEMLNIRLHKNTKSIELNK